MAFVCKLGVIGWDYFNIVEELYAKFERRRIVK
jgi:hypothetical protein